MNTNIFLPAAAVALSPVAAYAGAATPSYPTDEEVTRTMRQMAWPSDVPPLEFPANETEAHAEVTGIVATAQGCMMMAADHSFTSGARDVTALLRSVEMFDCMVFMTVNMEAILGRSLTHDPKTSQFQNLMIAMEPEMVCKSVSDRRRYVVENGTTVYYPVKVAGCDGPQPVARLWYAKFFAWYKQ